MPEKILSIQTLSHMYVCIDIYIYIWYTYVHVTCWYLASLYSHSCDWDFPTILGTYSRGLKSEQFSWMWTNRLRKSRHDRVTAGSQQSIKTQGDCLHLKDTKYHYNKHERAHPSHCRLLFCQHCFALQTIILPQWSDWEGVRLSERRKQWKEKK